MCRGGSIERYPEFLPWCAQVAENARRKEMDFGPRGQWHETPARVEPLKRPFEVAGFDRKGASIKPHQADIARSCSA